MQGTWIQSLVREQRFPHALEQLKDILESAGCRLPLLLSPGSSAAMKIQHSQNLKKNFFNYKQKNKRIRSQAIDGEKIINKRHLMNMLSKICKEYLNLDGKKQLDF